MVALLRLFSDLWLFELLCDLLTALAVEVLGASPVKDGQEVFSEEVDEVDRVASKAPIGSSDGHTYRLSRIQFCG